MDNLNPNFQKLILLLSYNPFKGKRVWGVEKSKKQIVQKTSHFFKINNYDSTLLTICMWH